MSCVPVCERRDDKARGVTQVLVAIANGSIDHSDHDLITLPVIPAPQPSACLALGMIQQQKPSPAYCTAVLRPPSVRLAQVAYNFSQALATKFVMALAHQSTSCMMSPDACACRNWLHARKCRDCNMTNCKQQRPLMALPIVCHLSLACWHSHIH